MLSHHCYDYSILLHGRHKPHLFGVVCKYVHFSQHNSRKTVKETIFHQPKYGLVGNHAMGTNYRMVEPLEEKNEKVTLGGIRNKVSHNLVQCRNTDWSTTHIQVARLSTQHERGEVWHGDVPVRCHRWRACRPSRGWETAAGSSRSWPLALRQTQTTVNSQVRLITHTNCCTHGCCLPPTYRLLGASHPVIGISIPELQLETDREFK